MDEDEVFQEHITVDLSGCRYVMEFWSSIGDAFDFGDNFGKNWSAFSDSIRRDCPAHKVTVIGANKLPKSWKNLNGISYYEMIQHILHENKKFKAQNNYAFDYEFIDA